MHGFPFRKKGSAAVFAGAAAMAAVGLQPISASGEDKTSVAYVSLAECGAIKSDDARLACFDTALDQAGAAGTGQAPGEDTVENVDAELIEQMQTNLAYAQDVEDRTFAFVPLFSVAPGSEPPDIDEIMRRDLARYCPDQGDPTMRLRCFDEYAAEIFLVAE